MFKKVTILALGFLMFFTAINPVLAESTSGELIGIEYADEVGLMNSAEENPKDMAVIIIQYLISFLGLIALSVILYGGFMWMTSAGNDDRLGKAKKIIIAGVIGLMIILVSYAIVEFITTMTDKALSGDLD